MSKLDMFVKAGNGAYLVVLKDDADRVELKGKGNYDEGVVAGISSLKEPRSITLHHRGIPTSSARKLARFARHQNHSLAFHRL